MSDDDGYPALTPFYNAGLIPQKKARADKVLCNPTWTEPNRFVDLIDANV